MIGRPFPNDILALSRLLAETEDTVRVWEWIAVNARPEHFTRFNIEPLVVSHEDFPMLIHLKEPSALSKLAGRVVVSNLREGTGGEFPKLRYFLTMAKNILEAERFGGVWEQFARERKEFGTRVANSLKGHWGRDPLSAHNMFENNIQRLLIKQVRKMASDLGRKGNSSQLRLARSLGDVADCYHLALSLSNGMFIPCSAWIIAAPYRIIIRWSAPTHFERRPAFMRMPSSKPIRKVITGWRIESTAVFPPMNSG